MAVKQTSIKNQQIASLVSPKSSALDIGCGIGDLAPLLVEKECSIDGLDKELNLSGGKSTFLSKFMVYRYRNI